MEAGAEIRALEDQEAQLDCVTRNSVCSKYLHMCIFIFFFSKLMMQFNNVLHLH